MSFFYILLALFIFSALIFIHELGHFLVARLCGVKVLEFAIGMGPKLLSWTSKKSGTKYAIRLLPIGGFVSMLGENGMEAVQGENGIEEDTEKNGEKKASDAEFFLNSAKEDYDPEGSYDPQKEYEEMVFNAEEAKHAYCNQSVWKRILISLAGPAMNVILGFILMAVLVVASGHESLATNKIGGFYVEYTAEASENGFQKGDNLYLINGQRVYSYNDLKGMVEANPDTPLEITVLRWNEEKADTELVALTVLLTEADLASFTASLSETSGLRIDDTVIKVNSVSVHTFNELAYEIMNQGYRPLTLTVLRNGEKVVLENVIVPSVESDGVVMGNVDFIPYREYSFDFATILKHTWFRSVSTVKMVFDSLGGLFSGRYGVEAVSGPVGITKTISDAAQMGWINVLYLVTVISINLGVMNLLPFPALDGGHLLIYIIEAIRRKPIKKELEGVINFIGLIILLSLAVIIMIKDIIAL